MSGGALDGSMLPLMSLKRANRDVRSFTSEPSIVSDPLANTFVRMGRPRAVDRDHSIGAIKL